MAHSSQRPCSSCPLVRSRADHRKIWGLLQPVWLLHTCQHGHSPIRPRRLRIVTILSAYHSLLCAAFLRAFKGPAQPQTSHLTGPELQYYSVPHRSLYKKYCHHPGRSLAKRGLRRRDSFLMHPWYTPFLGRSNACNQPACSEKLRESSTDYSFIYSSTVLPGASTDGAFCQSNHAGVPL